MSSPRRPHLLLVMPSLLPESIGGAERQCSILAPEFVKLGWDVTVLAPTCGGSAPDEVVSDGVRLFRLSVSHYPNLGGWYFASFLSWTLRAFFWIALRRANFDIIYVFHARLHATPAVLAAYLFRKPFFIKLGRGGHTFDFISLKTKKFLYGRAILGVVKRHTRAFIANSDEIVQDLLVSGIENHRIVRIPNGVPIREQILKPRSGMPRPVATFVYVGRLAPEKNLDLLIRAFAGMSGHQDAVLRIVGDGPLDGVLRKLAEGLVQSPDRILFVGQVSDPTPYYVAADFYVSTSDAEGQSNSLLEAMSWGTIPVVCAASGSAELVENGMTGILIPSLTIADIEAALERALALDPKKKRAVSAAAQAKMADTFGIHSVAQKTAEQFQVHIAPSLGRISHS